MEERLAEWEGASCESLQPGGAISDLGVRDLFHYSQGWGFKYDRRIIMLLPVFGQG